MHENATLITNESTSRPVLDGIALQTKPLPLYTTDPNQNGSIFTFAILLTCFNLKKLFAKKNNPAEILLGHAGSIFCARTETDLVFIACNEHDTTRDLTDELTRFPLSDLASCDFDNYPRSSEVRFQFKSGQQFSLHFVGQQSDVVKFIATLTD